MVIAAAFFFLLTGCAKVEVTPGPGKTGIPEVSQLLPPSGNYLITNTETEWGIVEYRIQFTDCDGKYRDIPLSMQESIIVCLQNGEVRTNFAHTIVLAK